MDDPCGGKPHAGEDGYSNLMTQRGLKITPSEWGFRVRSGCWTT